ncbi:MAG: outer membrane protein transport protein [Candidatus Aminicenantes bacterium]|nr:outer membrane protein transport protein [Candidatus Aminicenantes bacterium]
MRKFLKLFVTLGVISLFASGLYSNGINVNSVGTKAASMGGAFVGLADDYSAVYWNPAGLTQMEKASFTIFGEVALPTITYQTDFFTPFGLPAIDATSKKKVYPLGLIGYFKPISPKVVVGLSIYTPSGIGGAWEGSDLTNLTFPDPTAYTWESAVGAVTLAPVVAFKLSPKFSLGIALNLNYALLDMEMGTPFGQYTESMTGMGFGATIGVLFKPAKQFSMGLTVRTPSKLKLSGTLDIPGLALLGLSPSSDGNRDITNPLWIGFGIAIKATPKLTITADAQYTKWGDLATLDITLDDAGWKALGFEAAFSSTLDWEDRIQWRFGLEYMIKKGMALRLGYYIDPAPGPLSTLNILLPSPEANWLTFGFGMNTPKFNLDFGVDYNLGGKDREADLAGIIAGEAMPGTHGMKLWAFAFAFTFKF